MLKGANFVRSRRQVYCVQVFSFFEVIDCISCRVSCCVAAPETVCKVSSQLLRAASSGGLTSPPIPSAKSSLGLSLGHIFHFPLRD